MTTALIKNNGGQKKIKVLKYWYKDTVQLYPANISFRDKSKIKMKDN